MKFRFLSAAAAVLFLCVMTSGCEKETPPDHTTYEKVARDWLTSLNYKTDGVACSAQDSDKDGYITCMVRMGSKLSPLLCDTRGCKPKNPDEFIRQQ